MRFKAVLIVVNDIDKSKNFYMKVLCQKIKFDFGENIEFEGGFSIHLKDHFEKMVFLKNEDIKLDSNNFELYFEEDEFDSFLERLKTFDYINYVHDVKEHDWGQRAIRFYDPDMHIIEVGENMENVIKRFLRSGMTVEQTADKTQHPVDYVKKIL